MKVFLLLVFLFFSASLQARQILGCGPQWLQSFLPMADILASADDQYLAVGCYLTHNPVAGRSRWFPQLPQLQLISALPTAASKAEEDAQFQRAHIRLPIRRFQHTQLAIMADYQQQQIRSELLQDTYWARADRILASGQSLLIEHQQLRYGLEFTLLDADKWLNTLSVAYEQNKQPVHLNQQQPGRIDVLTPTLYDISQIAAGYRAQRWGWNLNWQLALGYGYLRDNGVSLLQDSDQDSRFNHLRLELEWRYRWRLSQRISVQSGVVGEFQYFDFGKQNRQQRYQFNSGSAELYRLFAGLEWRF
ncbi:hypothetical protein [Bacterioplanoides sp.]|uniref:hypothetical protein n=1 Tax=Bacterioplanoides sp. TaxID=2066072 RepID=UPI003AFFD157